MIFNSICILGYIALMIFMSVIKYNPGDFHNNMEDEVAEKIGGLYVMTMTFLSVGLLVSCVVIYGALQYNVSTIMFGVFWIFIDLGYLLYCLITLGFPVYSIISSVIGSAVMLYPHIVLISEIKGGIIPKKKDQKRYSFCYGDQQ